MNRHLIKSTDACIICIIANDWKSNNRNIKQNNKKKNNSKNDTRIKTSLKIDRYFSFDLKNVFKLFLIISIIVGFEKKKMKNRNSQDLGI